MADREGPGKNTERLCLFEVQDNSITYYQFQPYTDVSCLSATVENRIQVGLKADLECRDFEEKMKREREREVNYNAVAVLGRTQQP